MFRLEDFDAVIFHPRVVNISELPERRKSNQFYIYYNIEGPLITASSYQGRYWVVIEHNHRVVPSYCSRYFALIGSALL